MSKTSECATSCVFAIHTTWSMLLAYTFWDWSTVNRLKRWVTIFFQASNFVRVWLCCPSSDKCLCRWRTESDPQDGTNYSLPDIARDHHLRISTVTIMTSQGPLGGVGILWYAALESLWQHRLEEHNNICTGQSAFSGGFKVKYRAFWWCFHLSCMVSKPIYTALLMREFDL